jgi:hypothetical protein
MTRKKTAAADQQSLVGEPDAAAGTSLAGDAEPAEAAASVPALEGGAETEPGSELRAELTIISTAISEFERVEAGLAELDRRYKDVAYAVGTAKGMEEARLARADIRTPRLAVEAARVAGKAPVLKLGRNIDARAKYITERLQALEDPIHDQIKAENDRIEAEREIQRKRKRDLIAGIQTLIAETFTNVPVSMVGRSAADVEARIQTMVGEAVDQRFGDFQADAAIRKDEALARLRGLHAMAEAAEERERRAQAELQALRDRQAEQERVDAIRQRIAGIARRAEGLTGKGSALAAEVIADLRAEAIDASGYGELVAEAEQARADTLAALEAVAASEAGREAEERRLADERAQLQRDQAVQRRQEQATRERYEAEEAEARQRRESADRETQALQEQTQMALQEIQGIQQQVIIAQTGRLGVRQGGTIECIRETLEETRRWTIDDRFGVLQAGAQQAKDSAVASIETLLERAEADGRREQEEAERLDAEARERFEAMALVARQREAEAAADQKVRDAAPRMLAVLVAVRGWLSKDCSEDVVNMVTDAIEAATEDPDPQPVYVDADGTRRDARGAVAAPIEPAAAA